MPANPPDIAALMAAAEALIEAGSTEDRSLVRAMLQLLPPATVKQLCQTITAQAEQIAWLHRRIATLSKRECRKAGVKHG